MLILARAVLEAVTAEWLRDTRDDDAGIPAGVLELPQF